MRKTAVIGAGRTGRGFVGRLLHEAGEKVLYIDKDAELIRKMREQKGFTVRFFGDTREPLWISGYEACTWEEADLSDVELLLVSVGGTHLKEVAEELKKRITDGPMRYIITCENAASPADTLQKGIDCDRVLVSEATVFCTTVQEGEIGIGSEDYPYLQFDQDRLNGYAPDVPSLRPVRNFGNFLTRKLFTYNAASSVIAYMGWLYGYSDYGEAANDPRILEMLDRNYAATNRALCREFGYDPAEQEEFALLSKKKFCNRAIADTVWRNAREPQRKLGPKERVIGPLLLLDRYGEDTSVLERTAAAMLRYEHEGETEWAELKRRYTPEELLCNIGGLEKGGRLINNILQYMKGQTQ